MVLKEELLAMRDNYAKKPLRNIYLSRPDWLRDDDPMSAVYTDKKLLLQKGTVVFAHIVQANSMLFNRIPPFNYPAHIVYSTDSLIVEEPGVLRTVARNLFSYKNEPPEKVPKEWREIVRVIADEYDRTGFTFLVEHKGRSVEVHMIPVVIFRKLLPKRKLCGSFLPILTVPESKTIMVLPKRYWTKEFKKAWCDGMA